MKIVAWRKAGDLPKDELVMAVLVDSVKTTKAGVKFAAENPHEFEQDDIIEVIIPGKQFKIKETTQISIAWEGDKD